MRPEWVAIISVAILTLVFICVIAIFFDTQSKNDSAEKLIASYRTLTEALKNEIAAKDNLIQSQDHLLEERAKMIDFLKSANSKTTPQPPIGE